MRRIEAVQRRSIRKISLLTGAGVGFKATPGSGHVFPWPVARGEVHPIAAPFALERFSSGQLVDEHGAAAVAH